jgi:hypothetical protein
MLTNMKSLFRFGLMCAFFVAVAPLVSFAARDDVSLDNGTLLTVDGLSFTVTGSAGALLDSISVGTNSLTLTMSPDTRFQITSTDRRTITATGLATVEETNTCSSSESVYIYKNPAAAPSAATVTLTINSGTCGSSGSSGGSPGSSGGGSAYVASSRPQRIYPDGTIVFLDEAGAQEKVAKLDAKFQVTAAVAGAPKATVSAPAAVSAISGSITRALSKGTTNPQVKVLQQILNSDPATRITESGIGSPGNETDYFGPATVRAVQKFQIKYAIAKPGDSGYGSVGPLTRTILNSLAGKASGPDQQIEDAMKQIKILQDQLKSQ